MDAFQVCFVWAVTATLPQMERSGTQKYQRLRAWEPPPQEQGNRRRSAAMMAMAVRCAAAGRVILSLQRYDWDSRRGDGLWAAALLLAPSKEYGEEHSHAGCDDEDKGGQCVVAGPLYGEELQRVV
eukprot:CAMPEP_0181230932 /NCGR_PEP_ID=MMETSP1096-20121128/34780_1 /TAXON_ID=156174 ORGANISM="Chrysochromulina ericina, Strain CCMP281" /NCGR_SAMPLE_ID=MMETSP1096 /ASSEMBLY_ACC=CAM_ASM_000453 /LENGTH=125 /DNA_ID=CAMNT_0023324827 /DNA_START=40 /DNA_END=418 /DNA_ORIENTATION=+